MRLTERVYLVGSGASGFSLTHYSDCHIYLIDGGSESALIDAGTGMGIADVLESIRAHGFSPEAIHYLFLTHLHADHAGGAAALHGALDNLQVLVSQKMAFALRAGDEAAIGLDAGKKGGYYEPEYQFLPCPVDVELVDEQMIQVGEVNIRALETPGHCAGHMTYVMEDAGRIYMFSGDNLFYGGKILLQPIPDCNLQEHIRSIEKLAGLNVDVFLPGHGCISLKDGQCHITEALDWLERCLIPPSLL
jgi:hydroxyacylglutathione hydrolase